MRTRNGALQSWGRFPGGDSAWAEFSTVCKHQRNECWRWKSKEGFTGCKSTALRGKSVSGKQDTGLCCWKEMCEVWAIQGEAGEVSQYQVMNDLIATLRKPGYL
jgi:hypothetical protein